MRAFIVVWLCLVRTVVAQQSESIEMIPLQAFDVQIAVQENRGIQQREVSKIVTEWLNASYETTLTEFGYTVENGYAKFDSVGLLYNTDTVARRSLRGTEFLYTAKFKGGVVFSKQGEDVLSVPQNDVIYIQQLTLHDDAALAERLRNSEYETLGSQVLHATAFLNSVTKTKDGEEVTGSSLEAVIIGAIAVAGVAFLFLLAAVVWAYRFEAKQEAFKVKPNTDVDKTDTDTALDETPEKMPPPIVIQDDDQQYPESVISDSLISGSVVSEDVSASLSQYYRSGMGSKPNLYRSGMLSDAGSVSSMESYGYSIDAGIMPLPTELSFGGDDGVQRIGGLPIEPQDFDMMSQSEASSEVNLPDLDKELGHLNIHLTPMTASSDDAPSIDFSDHDDIVSHSENNPALQPK